MSRQARPASQVVKKSKNKGDTRQFAAVAPLDMAQIVNAVTSKAQTGLDEITFGGGDLFPYEYDSTEEI